MSRKTVVFKKPQTEVARLGGAVAPLAADLPAGERWIHGREDDPLRPVAPGFPVDLAAERSLAEIAMLSLALPTVLGWFWFVNAFRRYRRIFAP